MPKTTTPGGKNVVRAAQAVRKEMNEKAKKNRERKKANEPT